MRRYENVSEVNESGDHCNEIVALGFRSVMGAMHGSTIMLHTDAITDRFCLSVAASARLTESRWALFRTIFLALSRVRIAREDACLPMEASDHMLIDLGIGRHDVRRAGASRHEPWPAGANGS